MTKNLGTKSHHICKNQDSKDYESTWTKNENIYASLLGVDAVVILTEWDIYKNLDWKKISELMRKPAWVFDTRGLVDISKLNNTDLNFWKIGDGLEKSYE